MCADRIHLVDSLREANFKIPGENSPLLALFFIIIIIGSIFCHQFAAGEHITCRQDVAI